MQGPSEMGASGKLEKWDRVADLSKISVQTLVIGAKYDTMDPAHMEKMSRLVQHAGICSARTAATWRCTTIRRPTSPGWSNSSRM